MKSVNFRRKYSVFIAFRLLETLFFVVCLNLKLTSITFHFGSLNILTLHEGGGGGGGVTCICQDVGMCHYFRYFWIFRYLFGLFRDFWVSIFG